jgi:hypothetical protein
MQSVGVIHQYVRDTEKSIYRLTTVSGRTIVATDNHPFITEEGWKSVEDIRGSPVKKLGIVPNWVDSNSADAIHARLYGFYHAKHTFDTKEDADEFDRDVLTITTVPIMLLSTIEHSTVIPEWILSGSDQVKREFLAGFQSSSIIKHHPSKDTLLTYLTHVQRLYAHFGVECDIVQNESYSEVGLTLSSTPSNVIRCYDKIGYRYSTSHIVEGFKNVECLKSKGLLREDMTSRGRIVFVPLESIEEHQNVRIADITVDNENHSFITSHNIGSHNSSMGKQAMGIYALNFRERFDAMSHVLCYPEVPMVSTFMSRFYGAQKLPAGQNIVVAIMTYTGYNQEDSNMINRAALDRGRFRSIFYRTYKDEERKNQSSGEEEKFCRPEPTETKHMKNAHYEKIGDDGVIPRNTFVTPDVILIGKVVPLRVPTGAVLPAGAKKSRDVSKMPRNNEKGYVDKIYKNRNGEGYSFVKIRMRQDRIPEIGDKFSCYSDDTDILTARGWIRFPELTMEDQVATLMEDEKTMQYTKPLEVMSYDYTGNMYSIQSNQVDLMVTPNHRMYIGNRNGEKFGFQLAEDVYGKRLCYKKNVESYTPPIIGRPTELSYLHLESGEMMQEAQSFIIRGVHTANMINRTDKYIPMDDWLIMFGIWMAEGNASATYVDFATNKSRVREELDRIGSTCGIKFIKGVSRKTDDVNTSYRICSLNDSQYFHPLSVGSTNKSLPAWVWYLTKAQCQTLIRGMMLGDGHTMTNGTRRYDTSSKRLADDFQRLCFHAGYSSNINLKYAAGHETVVKKQGHNYENKVIRSTTDAYRLTIIEKQCIPLVNKNITQTGEKRLDSWVPYDGKVYCCRVQGPGAVYVRRNNIPVWSGNSRHGSFEPYSAG